VSARRGMIYGEKIEKQSTMKKKVTIKKILSELQRNNFGDVFGTNVLSEVGNYVK
jgi:hypothetical protein